VAGDAEIQIRRGIDACFGNVDQPQVLAFQPDIAVRQVVAPLDFARARKRARAGPGRGTEFEFVGDDARLRLATPASTR
jgi:hypothetical protein